MAKMGRPRKPRNPVGRPKGGTDAKKRKTKTFWSGADLKFLRENWDFMKTMDIAKHLNKSQSTIRSTAKELGFKPKYFCRDISRAMQLDDFKGKSGIYGIVNTRSTKVYIGSSVDCYARLQTHLYNLKKGTHINKALQDEYNDTFYLVMFEECSESELLTKETEYHHKYSSYCLYNTWSNVENPEDCEFLQTATERLKHTVNDNGCWIWEKRCDKSGYGAIAVTKDCTTKYFKAHRVSYFKETGEYPPLLRHTCNNKSCINPNHLIAGSHKENNLDKFIEFDKEFEEVWVKYQGDVIKITEHFDWKPNMKLYRKNNVASRQAYHFERKLGLRRKYPKIAFRGRVLDLDHFTGFLEEFNNDVREFRKYTGMSKSQTTKWLKRLKNKSGHFVID